MKFIPHKYQAYAKDIIIEQPAAGLFLEMGLGKTVTTLTALDELMFDYFLVERPLVIAPLRVAEDTWSSEIEKWDHLKHLRISKVLGSAKDRLLALEDDADIYVINRENVQWLLEQYGRYAKPSNKTGFKFTRPWPFDMVVIDELSSFKSQTSKRWKMLKKARPYIERIVGLTGTPAPNGLLDLWPQLYLLDGGERLGKTVGGYRSRYFMPTAHTKNARGNLIATGYAPVEGAEESIYDKISDICVSMKSEDWLDLPEKVDNIVEVNLGRDLMRKYKELARESILELDPEVIDAGSAAAITNKLQQFSQGEIYVTKSDTVHLHDKKLEALAELVEEANGRPVMVLYWYKFEEDRIKKYLKQRMGKKATIRSYKGSKDKTDWNNGKIDVLLLHPASAGHGLNLQEGGNIQIWYGLTWNLELYQQTVARLYRQGQTRSVIVHHIVSKGTVDRRMMNVLEGKASKQDELMAAVKAMIEEYASS